MAHEMRLIEPVSRPRNGIHASPQIERGTHGTHAAQLARARRPEFSGHLQNQIAAHRISREKDPRQLVAFDQLKKNRAEIRAQPGIVESRGQPFRAATISLVDPQDIEALGKSPRRQAPHVRRFARALEAMHERKRRRSPRLALPVAARQQLRSRLHFEEAILRAPQLRRAPRQQSSRQRHRMRAPPPPMRLELLHRSPVLRRAHQPTTPQSLPAVGVPAWAPAANILLSPSRVVPMKSRVDAYATDRPLALSAPPPQHQLPAKHPPP